MNGRKVAGTPTELRALISRKDAIAVPGVFNGALAVLAQEIGFKALYFSGAAFSGSLGLPDIGLITLSEVAEAVGQITSRVHAPLIVDVDTGFGEVVNVVRTIGALERLNAAAVQIEDQVMPKRCGHLEGKQLVEPSEMARKVAAAKKASRTNIVVIARTDAASVEGIDAAVDRARTYLRAGADIIFPEALKNKQEFREFARKVRAPLLANMTEFGKTEYLTVSEFASMGYKLVIFPVSAFRVMMGSVRDALLVLSKTGTQKSLLERMMTRGQFYELIGYKTYEAIDSTVARSAARTLDID